MYISYIVCILSIYEWKGKKPLSVCWDDWEGPSSHKHIVHIPASTSLLFFQSLSHVCLFAVPWTIACQASLSLTISWSLPKFMAMESVMLSSHLILCHPLLLPPSIFPSIGDFTMSRFFTSGGQSTGVSASASVLSMSTQGWFPLGWTGWISVLPKWVSRVFSSTTVRKHQFFGTQPSLWSSSHSGTWLLERPELWLYGPLSAMCCLGFLTCCLGLHSFVIVFLPQEPHDSIKRQKVCFSVLFSSLEYLCFFSLSKFYLYYKDNQVLSLDWTLLATHTQQSLLLTLCVGFIFSWF